MFDADQTSLPNVPAECICRVGDSPLLLEIGSWKRRVWGAERTPCEKRELLQEAAAQTPLRVLRKMNADQKWLMAGFESAWPSGMEVAGGG